VIGLKKSEKKFIIKLLIIIFISGIKNASSTKYEFRLPKVEFDENFSVKSIGNIMSNKLFTTFEFDKDILTRMISGLVLAASKISWLRKPDKKMEELDQAFKGTWFEGKSFNEVMSFCGVWNLNYYISDNDLDDLALTVIQRWNTGKIKKFERILNIKEFEFTDHGTDAQLIQIDPKYFNKSTNNMFEMAYYKIKGKAVSTTPFKVSENNAILGVMAGFTHGLEFKSHWEVNHDSKNRSILYEFLKNDFKNT